jgi:hypothetical protein
LLVYDSVFGSLSFSAVMLIVLGGVL